MSQRTEILGVQYLRGFCAAAVVVDHTSSMASSPKYLGRTVLGHALEHGAVGVDIFFVISGFIITVVALGSADGKPSLSRFSFFKKRFARIIPLMWLAVISHLVMRRVASSDEIVVFDYLRAMVLFPSGLVEPSPIWTLRHEFIFYGLFALSFLGVRRFPAVLALWCAAPVMLTLVEGPAAHDELRLTSIALGAANLEFGAGVLVGWAWLRGIGRRGVDVPVNAFALLGFLTLGVITLSAATPAPWLSVENALLTGLLGGMLVWFAARVHCKPGLLSRLGRLLGDASYSIYLFHMHCVAIILGVLHRLAAGVSPGPLILFVSVIAVASGVVIHLLIERPLVRLVQHWLRTRTMGTPVTLPGA